MGKIRLLPEESANQVAAGEVVERPASLVKELVENSLDAHATRIAVDFVRAGTRLVSVVDDGDGMDREDALMCLERHATSKIRSGADLVGVRTMGFRGEALPSIASVSRFRLVTREPSAATATEVLINGGKLEDVREAGAPAGTSIEVRDLFYNVPARRKFLRGEETEAAQILQIMQIIALANPSVAFDLRREGRPLFSVPRASGLKVRLADLFGRDFLSRVEEMPAFEHDGIRIHGFLSKPGEGRRDRHQQYILLNGRPILCPEVQQPLHEAFSEALPRGLHPLAVLSLELDGSLVDCNVHPAKRLVRFSRPDTIRRAVYDAATAFLHRQKPSPPTAPVPPPPSAPPVVSPREPSRLTPPSPVVVEKIPASAPVPPPVRPLPTRPAPATQAELPRAVSTSPVTTPQPTPPPYRHVGAVGEFYLLFEGPEGLVILDVRSATQRIHFERLLREMESGHTPSQKLLIPETVELPARDTAWIVEHLEDLRLAGFLVEPFGGTTLKIEAIPAIQTTLAPMEALHEIVTALRAAGRLAPGKGLREAVARSVCQLIRAERWQQNSARATDLLAELLRCDLPYASPLGHPTLIQFSFQELARKFSR